MLRGALDASIEATGSALPKPSGSTMCSTG